MSARCVRRELASTPFCARENSREQRNNMAETQAAQGFKNEKIGQVVSTKMAKTIVVEVSRRVPHPLYKRIVAKRKKFYAHDEQGTAKMGDVVRIVERSEERRVGKEWR